VGLSALPASDEKSVSRYLEGAGILREGE